MKKTKILLVFIFALLFTTKQLLSQQSQPNILWILTDDHRYDAIRSFNKLLNQREMSELGYVESPQTDRLVSMGTTFLNTYCHSAGCAPSRSAMHLGRYPFRSGVYEFEYYNNNAEHCRPSLPEQMVSLGYQTVHVGKLGLRMKTIDGDKVKSAKLYQTDVNFKQQHKDGLTEWGKDHFTEIDGKKLGESFEIRYFVTPEGTFEYVDEDLEKKFPEYKGTGRMTMEKYDLLRHYTPKKPKSDFEGGVLSGVSSQPAGKTRDGYYESILEDILKNENKTFKVGSQTVKGVDPSKPLFCHLGFDFPHTPVLPPADYRERFAKHTYKVPAFDEKELKTMSKQHKAQVTSDYSDHFTDIEKQKMIQDYYAFCAYGDDLVGKAADAFIKYSESHNQEWLIMFVCGDHGWKLNDHGSVSKFSAWDIDTHNPIVIVSSDKKTFPAGKVVRDFTEFVDIAPTLLAAGGANLNDDKFDYLDGMNLASVANGKAPVRDYVIGESHAVTGPRGFIRTKDYVFSMKTRPTKNRGQDMDWVLKATYEDVDPELHYMPSDPHEIKNLAFDASYKEIAMKMKEKLINILFGDNRVEVGWGKKADGTEVYRSNFAPGSHDYKLDLK